MNKPFSVAVLFIAALIVLYSSSYLLRLFVQSKTKTATTVTTHHSNHHHWWEDGDEYYLSRPDLIDLPVYPTNQPQAQHSDPSLADRSGLGIFHYPYFQYQQGILDHQWVPMTYEEAHQYYNAHETCMAMADAPARCELDPNGSPFRHRDLGGCGIHNRGLIYAHDVSCPNMKGNFLRHVSTKPWLESKKHIVDIMARMLSHRNTSSSNLIYFIGDSVTGQHFADVLCSLSRVGLQFAAIGTEMLIVKDPNHDDSHPINSIHDPERDKNEDFTQRYFLFRNIRYDRERNHRWSEALEELQRTLTPYHQAPSRQTQSVVFIVNMGLHFNIRQETDNLSYQQEELEEMRTNLRTYFTYLISLAKEYGHIIIFRETSAQHFSKRNGLFSEENVQSIPSDYDFSVLEDKQVDNQVYYSSLMNPEKRRQIYRNDTLVNRPDIRMCRPFRTKQELHANNWKNREVFRILKELDPTHEYVHVARFHEVTAGRHDFHADGTDCTHFCSSSIIWYPLWQQIYDIVDQVFQKRENSLSHHGIR